MATGDGSGGKGEGDEGGAGFRVGAEVLVFEGLFEGAEGGVHLGGEYLGVGGAVEAEFAEGEAGVGVGVVVADGWAEGAAEDGAVGVEVAGLGGGVEDGAGLGGEAFFEEVCSFFFLFAAAQDAGERVSGEEGGKDRAGVGEAGVDAGGAGGVFGLGEGETGAEAVGVEGGDLEDAVAALGAAGFADEEGAGAGGGGGEAGGDDLEEGFGHAGGARICGMDEVSYRALGSATTRLREALGRMEEHLDDDLTGPMRDSVLLSFQFTFGLCRPMLERFLVGLGEDPQIVEGMSFAAVIRSGNERGVVRGEWAVWSGFRDARNRMAHLYSSAAAEGILAIVPAFLEEAEFLLEHLEGRGRGE